MRLFFSVLALVLTLTCLGQTSLSDLKTKTIDYKNGKATYEYYEDSKTSELIKHGSFHYSENQKGEFGSQIVTIKGMFKDGLREGAWIFTIKKVDAENNNGTYTTGTLTSTQNFSNGFPDGKWQLNHTWKTRRRKLENYQYVWSSYSNVKEEYVSCEFKNGVMIGTVSYKTDGEENVINLNSDGFVYGDFSETFGGTIREKSFNSNGVMTKSVERLPSSGKILNNLDFDADLLKIADDFVAGKLTTNDLRNSQIKVDTIKGEAEDAGLLFYSDYFYLPGIGGDKTIIGNENYRIHGRYLKFERIEIVYYERHNKWPRKYTDYSDSKSKIKCYQNFLTYYGQEVSKDDNATIQKLIDDEKKKVNGQLLDKEYQEKFDEYEVYVNNLRKEKHEYLNKVMNDLNSNNSEITSSFAKVLNDLLKKEATLNSQCHISRMHGIDLSQKTDNKKRFEYAENCRLIATKEYIPLVNQIDSIVTKSIFISSIISDISNIYNSSTGTKIKTFNIYNDLKKQVLAQISGESNPEKVIEKLQLVVDLSNRAKYLSGLDCKELVKSLKKVNSMDEKVKIFMGS